MRVGILGCGPAGLFAAHAAAQLGHEVRIYSKPRKSYMRGAQYLHRPIPGLTTESFQVDYRLEGEAEGYRSKVYGDLTDIQVSPETLTGLAEAWDIREAYEAAWQLYSNRVVPWDVNDGGLLWIGHTNDIVVSTIPAKLLCKNPDHEFRSQKIWATNFVKRLGAFEDPTVDNLVVCSGFEDDWWYRQSRIHGWENTEFPHDKRPQTDSVWEVEKPIDHNCNCFPWVARLGRYGSWKKGVLSDSAYYDLPALLA